MTLTHREREVQTLLESYLSNKEIAARLHVSTRTVKFHVSNLLRKFGVETRHELTRALARERARLQMLVRAMVIERRLSP